MRILDALDQVAGRFDSTLAAGSLAWVMARPGIIAPIASAANLDQLNDFVKAANLKPDPVSIGQLEKASSY